MHMRKETDDRPGFYEFFCGGGMARLGLGEMWQCLFANDIDAGKAAAYRENFGGAPELVCGDVRTVAGEELPPGAALAWASFPCQDLSLAGAGAGLAGGRSGVFWAFWDLMQALRRDGRHPPIIAIENVAGLVTSHGGGDLAGLAEAMVAGGYRLGAVLVDGVRFVPQSRPRLFIVAAAQDVPVPAAPQRAAPDPAWHAPSLTNVVDQLPTAVRQGWIWWRLPLPPERTLRLIDVIEDDPRDVCWHAPAQTEALLAMMAPAHRERVAAAMRAGTRQVGCVYKRTRQGVQRAEVRFDGVSGCLRTPAGGSSRQTIVEVQGARVRTRLISARETARLMGLPDTYRLPARYNDAYRLTGDGVVVPAAAWVARHLLDPLARQALSTAAVRRAG